MALDDAQMARFVELDGKKSLSDAEMAEFEHLDSLTTGAPPETPPPGAPPGFVGSVRVGETPEAAAQRLGGTYVSPEQTRPIIQNAVNQAALEPTISATSGALMNTLAPLAAGTEAFNEVGQANPMPFSLVRPEVRQLLEQRYRERLPDWQTITKKSSADHPGAYLAGAAGPSMLGAPASVLGRVGLATAQGAVSGGAGSSANLRDEPEAVVGDAAAGGALGFLGGLAGEGVSAGLRGIASGASSRAAEAAQRLRDMLQKAADKAEASAYGTLGNIGMEESNVARTAFRVLANRGYFDPATIARAEAFLSSPEGQEIIKRGANNTFDKTPRLLPKETDARAVLSDATAAAQPSAVAAKAADKLEPGNAVSDFGSKLWKSVGQRAVVGGLGAMAGSALSSLTGSDRSISMGGGALAGLGLSAPGTLQFLRNSAANPAFQHTALTALEGLTAGPRALIPGAEAAVSATSGAAISSAEDSLKNAVDWFASKFGRQPNDKAELAGSAFVAGQGGQ